MELTDELRYPTIYMISSTIHEASTFAELESIARPGILAWFLQKKKTPAGDEPLYEGSAILGVAFHRGVAAMERIHAQIHLLKDGHCGPSRFPLDHRRCKDPARPLHALYLATRTLDPYLKGIYRLDAFLEQIQHAIWNDLHGIAPSEELSAKIEAFARTAIPFETPRQKRGERVYDWLATTLEWLNWIEHFHV